MKVRELIKELLDYNLDAEVVTSHTETVEVCYSGEWGVTDGSDKKSTPFVFIDGCDLEQDIE